jgi:beta-lactam-binding protein with PASTA domain
MGALALGLIIALYIGLLSGTRHGRVIAVPDFRGMNIVDARHVADVADLNIIVRDSIFDVDLPGGTVVDQLPRTSDVRDVTVKPGRKVYLTINAYSRRMVDVPYVAKQTLRQALNQLEREGLTVQKIVYEPDLTSTDYVLRQLVDGKEIHPESKIKVAVGTGVVLYVSYRSEEQNTSVPRLVGLSFAQAKSAVWDNGLNIGKVIYDESVEDIVMRRKARVYKQSLRQSSSVSRGCELSLYLTCDEELLEKSSIEAEAEAKLIEEERRKAEEAELEAMADAME